MRTEREPLWDVAKGIGILLVLWGHSAYWGTMPSRLIYSFHMPLFFLVSGMLFDPVRYQSLGMIVKKSVIGLLVPYLFFAAVAFAVKFDIQVPLLISRFPTQVYGLFVRGDCIWALWFLVCLASTRVAYFVAYRVGAERNVLTKVLFACGCLVLAEFSMTFLYPYRKAIPLMLSSVPAALFFFAIGRWMKPSFEKWCERLAHFPAGFPVCLVSMALCIGFSIYLPAQRYDLRAGVFSTSGLPACFAGILALIAIAALLRQRDGGIAAAVKYIGKYSLVFFAMEQNASHVFTVILRACGINAPEVYYMVSGMIGLKIARMVFCLLVVALIAPAVGALVRKIQERVEGGLQWVN